MKKLVLPVVFLLMAPSFITGATYYSQGSLPPELLSSWNDLRSGGGNPPPTFVSGDVFVVQQGHLMTTAAAWTISGSGSRLWIESGGEIVADFPVTLSSATVFQIDDGGTYIHNNTGIPSSTIFKGTEAFGTGSTFHIKNWIGNLYVIPFGVAWGNLIIDVPLLNGSWNQVGNVANVRGTLDIRQTGGELNEFRLCSRNTNTYTFNIANISISGGILSIEGGGSSGTPSMTTNVSGEITMTGGKLDLGTNGSSVLNVGGNISVSGSGYLTNSGATSKIIFDKAGIQTISLTEGAMNIHNIDVEISLSGIVDMTSAWALNPLSTLTIFGTLNTNGFTLRPRVVNVSGVLNIPSGTVEQIGTGAIMVGGLTAGNTGIINCSGVINMAPSSFASFLVQPGGTVNLDNGTINMNHDQAIFFIDNGGTLNCGTGKVASINSTSPTFILNPGGNLSIGSPDGITLTGVTGNIQVAGSRSFHYAANYRYEGNVQQVTGNGLPETINDLAIENPAGVTLSGDLRVTGTTTLTGADCLKIPSGISFIDNGESSSGSGNAVVERFIEGDAWHYISSPVQSALSGIFTGDYLKTYAEGTLAFGPYISSPSVSLDPARGYAVWATGGHSVSFCGGKLNTGLKEILITRTYTGQPGNNAYDGWNLTGNPYPCAVNLDSVFGSWENAEPTAYFWDQSVNGSGNYSVYPALAGFGTHSQYVPAMQGFFVHCDAPATPDTPGTGMIRFNISSRLHTPEPFLKPGKRIADVLVVNVTGFANTYSDKVVVHFDPHGTTGYDPGFDAYKLWGLEEAPQLYTSCEDDLPLSFNVLPFTKTGTVVPIGFRCLGSGTYRLEADSVSTFGDSLGVCLEDLQTGVWTDLRSTSFYEFEYEKNDPDYRFRLHFGGGMPGDVTDSRLQQVSIRANGSDVVISNSSGEPLNGEVFIRDLMGRELFRCRLKDNPVNRINPGLKTGVYFIHVQSNKGSINRTIFLR